jgi:hypothetical protein
MIQHIDDETAAADNKVERISQTGLADMLGVQRQSVHELVRRGVLIPDADGLLGIAAARDAILANNHPDSKTYRAAIEVLGGQPPAQAQTGADPGPSTTSETARRRAEAVARREEIEAEIAQMRLDLERGKLLLAAAVWAEWGRKVAAMREAQLQIPSRLTPVLAAESDPKKIYAMLDAELRAVLQFVSDPTTTEETENGQ